MALLKKKTVDIRVGKITSHVRQLFLGARNNRVSFRHAWDQVALLLQYPTTFFLFTENKDGAFEEFYRVSKDPRATKRFDDLIKELESNQEILKASLFPIFPNASWYQNSTLEDVNTDQPFYILIVAVYDFNAKGNNIRYMRPILNDLQYYKSGTFFEQYRNVFSNRKEPNASNLVKLLKGFFLGKNEESTQGFQAQVLDSIVRLSTEPDDEYKIKDDFNEGFEKLKVYREVLSYSKFDLDKLVVRERYIDKDNIFPQIKNKGYLDSVFHKVKDGLETLQDSGSSIDLQKNLSLFISNCAGNNGSYHNKKRCGYYSYGLSLHLFKEQRDELEDHFRTQLVNKRNFKEQYQRTKDGQNLEPLLFSQLIFDVEAKSELESKYLTKHLNLIDDWFWNCLESDAESDSKISELIDHLEFPFSDDLQSVTDATFYNGIVHFSAPFLNGGGIYRCFGGRKEAKIPKKLSKTNEEDLRRLCVTYYYYRSIMSTQMREYLDGKKNRANKIIVMLVPIEVAGAVYAVSSHVAFVANTDGKVIETDDEDWNRVVDIYNSLDKKVTSVLRRELKKLYMTYIELTFKYNWDELWQNIQMLNEEDEFTLKTVDNILNQGLSSLEYLIPYEKIVLTVVDHREKGYEIIKNVDSNAINLSGYDAFPLLEGKYSIYVTLEKNRFFRRSISDDVVFLKSEDIADKLGHMVKQLYYDLAISSYKSKELNNGSK